MALERISKGCSPSREAPVLNRLDMACAGHYHWVILGACCAGAEMHATWYERVISGDKKGLPASFVRAMLTMISAVYRMLHLLRAAAYKLRLRRIRSLPGKVVSVGNLTVGGTGKTPFVEALARMVKQKDYKPVILSRGYGSTDGAASDEYMVLAENLPGVAHYAHPSRYQAGMEAAGKEDPDIFLLDDGFQHWQLRRDLDIVLVDALNPFGYGRLTPRGMLREPLRALRRADVFVITRSNQALPAIIDMLKQTLRRINSEASLVVTHHEVRVLRDVRTRKKYDVEFLKGSRVLGFCGIGNPRAFHGLLVHLGAQVAAFHAFRDHFRYTPRIVELTVKEAQLRGCEVLVTTQKDAVKLRDYERELPILELLIGVRITEGRGELEERLARLLEDD